ncbi:MAG: hypothetical protein KJ052_15310 [Candidatus Hydrogenedentes bacterium]|nr:hypothetical protein [Candidatus Hydrogenedentota bacterium]
MNDETPMTQFGKACHSLGIPFIFANSQQTKGRVERAQDVLQGRLVEKLALKCLTDNKGANGRLVRPPKDKHNAHRKVPKKLKLDDIFCFEETRRLNNDWTERYKSRFYQVAPR